MDQELLRRHEYLVAENRLLRQQITGRVQRTDAQSKTLAEIGKKWGQKALAEVATLVKPDTMLIWHRQLIAQKFDGSQTRQSPGRPTIDAEVEALILRFAMARGEQAAASGMLQTSHRAAPGRTMHHGMEPCLCGADRLAPVCGADGAGGGVDAP